MVWSCVIIVRPSIFPYAVSNCVCVCLCVGGIDNTGIVKDIRGWRHESYVSLSCMHARTHTHAHVHTRSLPLLHVHDLIVHPNTQRSIAEVEWGTSGSRNIYRVGHKGKVDLKCDTPGDGGEYYPDHLPMSGGFALCHM